MNFEELPIKGAYRIEGFYSEDHRGSFFKSFEKDIYQEAGIDFTVNESFVSVSAKNVIRGLHFQTERPQAKLVCVLSGSAWDVIVDLRLNSPTFGQWYAEILSSENHNVFYIPRGFAHGFLALEDNTTMLYQCDGAYHKASDTGIWYDDSKIAVAWPIDISRQLYQKEIRNL